MGTFCSIAAFLVLGATAARGQYPNPYARPGYPNGAANGQAGSAMPAPVSLPAPGSQGQVLYFCKPADSQVPLSGSGTAGTPVVTPNGITPAVAETPGPQAAPMPVVPQPPATSLVPVPPTSGSTSAPSSGPISPPPSPSPTVLIPANPTPAVVFPQIPAPQAAQYGMQPPPTPKAVSPQPLPQGARPMNPPDYNQLSPEYRTDLPPRKEIFQMRNNKQLEEWVMEKVSQSQGIPLAELHYPEEEPIGLGLTYQAKTSQYPPQKATIEPLYLVHRRLLFEERNSERYGWDLGVVQPLVSAVYFYADFFLLPNSLVSGFAQGFWDTSAGKCLPGSPTPYLLYPPQLTISGSLAEAAVITGLSFAIP